MEKERSHFPWVIVGISFIVLGLVYSAWYSFSIFFVSLLREFGWNRSTAAGAFSLFILIHGLIGLPVGKMVDRLGPGKIFIWGSLFLAGGLGLCSLIHAHWQFYLFFGVITAIGVGTTGWIPNTTIIQQWFREKRGLPFGMISAGVGIGILLYVPSLQHLILRVGWRRTYLVMAFSIPLVIITAAIVLLRRPPPCAAETVGASSPSFSGDPCAVDRAWVSRTWTVREALRTWQFWHLCLLFLSSNFVIQAILAHQVAFFVDQGVNALRASYIVGTIGIVSIPGKVFWGTLSDRIGRELTYTLGLGCSFAGILCLILFAGFRSPFLPYAFAVSFGMGYAATASLAPLIIADFFSGKSFGSMVGTLWIPNGLGAAGGAWVAGLLFDRTGNYLTAFILMIGCTLCACLSIWKAAPRKIRSVPGRPRKIPSPTEA